MTKPATYLLCDDRLPSFTYARRTADELKPETIAGLKAIGDSKDLGNGYSIVRES